MSLASQSFRHYHASDPVFAAIGSRFHEVLQRYSHAVKHLDFVWRYSERPLVGALAASVWLEGGVALEEYGGKKVRPEKGYGRTDLYIALKGRECICEAKHRYLDMEQLNGDWTTELRLKCLRDSRNNELNGEERAYGVAFWSISIDKNENIKEQTVVNRIKDAVIVFREKVPPDVVLSVWHFPDEAFDLTQDQGEGRKHYLGVFMQMVEVPRLA